MASTWTRSRLWMGTIAEGSLSKHGKVIGFLGAKGGVGTTTTAVNVALTLLAPERSVVAVEMHFCMGTMAQQLGVTASLTLKPLLTCQDTGDINARTLGRCRHLLAAEE